MAKLKYTVNAIFQNSRYVNYNRWSEHPEVIALVEEIMSNFTASRKKQGYMDNMRVLVLDLFESYSADPEQYIEYRRDYAQFKFKRKSNRYTLNDLITGKNFVGAVNHLDNNKYIANFPGRHFTDENGDVYGYLSRMRPTQKFADICTKHKLTLDMICKYSEEELIRLQYPNVKRNKKIPLKDDVAFLNSGKPFLYDDTEETDGMRTVTRVYNLLMDNTHIDLDIECMSYADRDAVTEKLSEYADTENPEIILRLANRNVYRVFNNADISFRQGGRFYGAWWIGCPSVLRKYITIEGSPTVELDYSGIHIHLAYALEGINYASLKQKPYELVADDPDKKLNKLILLTAINADGEHSTASSVFNELRKDNKLFKYNIWSHHPIKSKLDLLTQKHEPIKAYIASSKGIYLQYFDSMIIELLIKYFTNRGIPILTIHDSVICKEEHQSIVTDQMYELFAHIINNQLRSEVHKISEGNPNRRLLHIKYQRQLNKIPNWLELIKSKQVSYKASSFISRNELNNNLIVTPNMINYFLRVDDLITIDQKAVRTHKCNSRCNTHKRHQRYLLNKKPCNVNIKIKLIKCECNYIQISNGH